MLFGASPGVRSIHSETEAGFSVERASPMSTRLDKTDCVYL